MENDNCENLSIDSSDSETEDIGTSDTSTADGLKFKKKFINLIKRVKRSRKESIDLEHAEDESQEDHKRQGHDTRSCEDKYSGVPNLCSSFAENTDTDCYEINRRNRGLAVFIINSRFDYQPFRPYAHIDQWYMTKLFKHMGFEIKCLENKKARELWRELIEIQRSITVDYDCLVVVISSHGAEFPLSRTLDPKRKLRQHVIFTRDADIPTDRILEVFNDDCCPSLIGKPRMFFIQACRCVMGADEEFDIDKGVNIEVTSAKIDGIKYPILHPKRWKQSTSDGDRISSDIKTNKRLPGVNQSPLLQCQNQPEDTSQPDTQGVPADTQTLSQRELYFRSKEPVSFCYIPCYEDYLVMFSSSSERTAWSDKGKGGWLLYCLYKMFKRLLDSDYKTDLLQILSEVSGKMARELRAETPSDSLRHRTKSTAIIYHMLTKNICLQPKHRITYHPMRETAL